MIVSGLWVEHFKTKYFPWETNGMLQICPCLWLCNFFVSAYMMAYKTYMYDFVLQNKHFHCTRCLMDSCVNKQYKWSLWRISILIILVAKWATSFSFLVAHRQDLVALASGRAVICNPGSFDVAGKIVFSLWRHGQRRNRTMPTMRAVLFCLLLQESAWIPCARSPSRIERSRTRLPVGLRSLMCEKLYNVRNCVYFSPEQRTVPWIKIFKGNAYLLQPKSYFTSDDSRAVTGLFGTGTSALRIGI